LDLLKTIKERVDRGSLGGLLKTVDMALKLCGDKDDLKALRGQLQEREKKIAEGLEKLAEKRGRLAQEQEEKAFTSAESLFAEGRAKEALILLEPYRGARYNYKIGKMLEKLEFIVAAENNLVAMVKESNSDGVISADEIVAMLPKAVEYLELNPNHSSMKKLCDELMVRLRNLPSIAISHISPQLLYSLPISNNNNVSPILTNSIGMKMKLLYPGRFMMGEERETHQVTLTKRVWISVYQVTQEQYGRVMGAKPSPCRGPRNPVEVISWEDALEFCRRLSEMREETLAARIYRLPTEAEWEYACRAGTPTIFTFGNDQSKLGEYAWYDNNSCGQTHPVGEKKPNAWGLYDMHGNVWEWCADWYGDYPKGAVTDPVGPSKGSFRVSRGGSWNNVAANCRSASRNRNDPSRRSYGLGFRVALNFSGIPK
jgi:formylglycine-generating enzyme required for sulfatase activity